MDNNKLDLEDKIDISQEGVAQVSPNEDEDDLEVVLDDVEDKSTPTEGGMPAKKVEPAEEEEEDLTEDEREKLGKRAQKRIQQLVRQRKELEERLRAVEAEKATFAKRNQEFDTVNTANRRALIQERLERLQASEAEVHTKIKEARTNDDTDLEIKALDALAAIKAEKLLAERVARTLDSEMETKSKNLTSSEVDEAKKKEVPDVQNKARPSRRALEWAKRNPWIVDDSTPANRVMIATAMQIHQDLIEQGIIPDDPSDPDEYYNELDVRIRKEFPDLKKKEPAKSTQIVTGTTRSALTTVGGKRRVTLTPSEVARAKSMGVTLEAYAREKARIVERGSSN